MNKRDRQGWRQILVPFKICISTIHGGQKCRYCKELVSAELTRMLAGAFNVETVRSRLKAMDVAEIKYALNISFHSRAFAFNGRVLKSFAQRPYKGLFFGYF